MLFSHHSHSLPNEYMKICNWNRKRGGAGKKKRNSEWNPGDCSDRLMGLLLPLFCSSSRALIHLAEQSESYFSHRWALLQIQHAQLAPEKTHQQGPARVDRTQQKRKWSWIENGDWLSVLPLSKPIHSQNQTANESRWQWRHLFTLTVMLRS